MLVVGDAHETVCRDTQAFLLDVRHRSVGAFPPLEPRKKLNMHNLFIVAHDVVCDRELRQRPQDEIHVVADRDDLSALLTGAQNAPEHALGRMRRVKCSYALAIRRAPHAKLGLVPDGEDDERRRLGFRPQPLGECMLLQCRLRTCMQEAGGRHRCHAFHLLEDWDGAGQSTLFLQVPHVDNLVSAARDELVHVSLHLAETNRGNGGQVVLHHCHALGTF
mmetsp:Transcript_97340/g.280165  ORF Transcript_97340/g.280165 Transcript_97340/m.280165 type:complete len:220 (-) Transcript_97340:634-1293(-)